MGEKEYIVVDPDSDVFVGTFDSKEEAKAYFIEMATQEEWRDVLELIGKTGKPFVEKGDPFVFTEGRSEQLHLVELEPPVASVRAKALVEVINSFAIEPDRVPLTNEQWDAVRMEPDPVAALTNGEELNTDIEARTNWAEECAGDPSHQFHTHDDDPIHDASVRELGYDDRGPEDMEGVATCDVCGRADDHQHADGDGFTEAETIENAENEISMAQYRELHNRLEDFVVYMVSEGYLAKQAIGADIGEGGIRGDNYQENLFELIEAYLDQANEHEDRGPLDQIIHPTMEEEES